MHELAIAQNIISVVSSESEKRNFTRVDEISLAIGEYSGIIPECLEEFFPIASAGTAAEGAKLSYKTIKAEFKCPECGYEGTIERKKACCPACGSCSVKMTKGREFYIESLKVE